MVLLNVLKVFAPATVAFFVGILITPVVSHYLYKHKLWKKRSAMQTIDGKDATITNTINQNEKPLMGGVVMWGSVLFTTLLFYVASLLDGSFAEKLNFLSRNQTWLPLFTLISGGIIGLIDDMLIVSPNFNKYFLRGHSLLKRLTVVLLVGLVGSWWFFSKLDVTNIIVPFLGEFNIGVWFIPFFIVVMFAVYSGSVIDGVDGLSGGVYGSIFASYGVIAFFQGQIDLSAFSFVIAGGLLAFLWFNIPPARFYLSETGSMALTLTLTVIAFLTKQVLVLPIIAFPLAITTLSVIVQLLSKKFRNGKKVFRVAPLHNHFQAIGWPNYKVTMRYWIVSIIVAIIGMLVALLG